MFKYQLSYLLLLSVLAAKPKFEQLALNKLEDRSTFDASVIAYDGTLILRSNENLYCIKKMN